MLQSYTSLSPEFLHGVDRDITFYISYSQSYLFYFLHSLQFHVQSVTPPGQH
jgi:hypothetical protein